MAPSSQGLYNPAFEHDACGVAMVADMHGRRSRDIVDKAITALVNLEHRGAQGAEPHTGDGAGILLQVPDEFLRAVVDFDLPEYGQLRHGHRVPAAVVQGRRDGLRGRGEDRRGRGARGAGLARGADRRFVPRRPGPRRDADVPAGVHRRRLGHGPGAARLRGAQARRARTRHEGPRPGRPGPRNRLLPKPFRPDVRLQGHADHAAAQGVLPGPAGRSAHQRAGHRALAVLDQHVPVVAAGPPVPADRPQRRDQHRHRQRELDAGARGADQHRRVRFGPRRAAIRLEPRQDRSRSAPRAPRTPRASTRCSSCCTSAAAACRTPC